MIPFTWDALGNLTGLTAPGRTSAYQMTNDLRGDLLTMTTPLGYETTYTFDLDYRPTGMTSADGRSTSVSYDSSNRIEQLVINGEHVEITYADTGQPADIVGGSTDLAYEWDGPLLTSQQSTGTAPGLITYAWEDGTLNLAEMNLNGTVVAYDFDTDGLPVAIGRQTLDYQAGTTFLTGRQVGNVLVSYTYDSYGQLQRESSRYNNTTLLDRTYAYDALGRIVEVAEDSAVGTTTHSYTYDLIGQLVAAEGTGALPYTHAYTYDPNGNRTSVSTTLDTLTSADIQHDADDRLLRYGNITLAYSDSGQLTERTDAGGTTLYDYGVSGELRRVDLSNGRVVGYEHDALRRRIARKVDGTTTHRFLYAGNINHVAEVDAAGNTISTFVYGTGINVPDYMERGGRTYAFVRDHLGSVRLVVDADEGTVVQELRYDEYGIITYDSAPGFQPFGFAGGLHDPDTNLVRFGARDYDPRIGRWTAPDPIRFSGGQANLFVHVANSPTTLTDPTGSAAWVLVPILAVPGVIGGTANWLTHRDQSTWAQAAAFANGLSGGMLSGVGALGGPFWAIGGTAAGGALTKWMNLRTCVDPVEDTYRNDVVAAGLVSAIGGALGVGFGAAAAGSAAALPSWLAEEVILAASSEGGSALMSWAVDTVLTPWDAL